MRNNHRQPDASDHAGGSMRNGNRECGDALADLASALIHSDRETAQKLAMLGAGHILNWQAELQKQLTRHRVRDRQHGDTRKGGAA